MYTLCTHYVTMSNYQLIYLKMRAVNQRSLKYVADEIYEEVLTPYHTIFGRNIMIIVRLILMKRQMIMFEQML